MSAAAIYAPSDSARRETRVAETLALVDEGLLTMGEAGSLLDLNEGELLELFGTMVHAVEKARGELLRSGRLAKARAVVGLTDAVARLSAAVRDPDIPAGVLNQLASTLHKVSGLDTAKPVDVSQQPRFSVNIILRGQAHTLGNGSPSVFVKPTEADDQAKVIDA